jgi:hypothetical protein
VDTPDSDSDDRSTPSGNLPFRRTGGLYPFNGNANDESGNGNNGTVSGANLLLIGLHCQLGVSVQREQRIIRYPRCRA